MGCTSSYVWQYDFVNSNKEACVTYGHTGQTVDFMSTAQDIGGGPQKADLLALPHLRSHKIDGISQ